ncbi:MAG: inorganic pyrophosphatase [Saprospiraceae bacterium]|nr:inorganic pyrophosphatase [Saprospiraceae bacterium]
MDSNKFKAHPWHGISPGDDIPRRVTAFIEIIPTDTVKYEIDKLSGYLKIDRPQKYSNVVPALYGFVPRTYCGPAIASLCMELTGLSHVEGDGDPLDILVLTERAIPRGDILVEAIPIGGFRMVDKNEADDKIIAVLKDDQLYGGFTELNQLPVGIVNRLRHYFMTYKQLPGEAEKVNIAGVYGREEAYRAINASVQDYMTYFS